jgi:hypothetical protein
LSPEENMLDAGFPVLLTTRAALAAFFVAWLTFHVLFVRVFKLGKIGWKRTDYAWLALAVLGLIGTVWSSQDSVETSTAWLMSRFKLLGT